MSVAKATVYIKAEAEKEVQKTDITLGDILSIECVNKNMLAHIKAQKIYKVPETGKHRCVISVLKIIECIHTLYPEAEIQNIGSTDIVVTYEMPKKNNKILYAFKVFVISTLVFIGAAFSIMAFNNDVNVPGLFDKIYSLFTGMQKEGISILEISYSAGITIGILVFFNHFGKKRFSVDPTPLEVEMRLYENDLQTTVVQNYSRKGQELDVDSTNTTGNHRS